MIITELETERLKLREWKKNDLIPFSKMNADSEVMEFLPKTLTQKESDDVAEKIIELIQKRGWGLLAVEVKETKQFIGFVGLHQKTYGFHFAPCVEIGWRLSKEYWGKGYTTEAAKAYLNFAFNNLKIKEIYSFTSILNPKSEAVMKRLGMKNTNENFENPALPENHRLSEQVLYKITNDEWLKIKQ